MKTSAITLAAEGARLKLALRGAVQGVGFRPFVYRLASELDLCGWVNNSPQGVFIEVEGGRYLLKQFLLRIETEKPPRSFIQSLEPSWLDAVGYEKFEIRESETDGDNTTLILPDTATCPDCLREILDPNNRRHRYPFTNCTNCGPRFSIIESLPYDRANTSMKAFTMCPICRAEYDDPRDRRFHAQPNACPVCGPALEFWERGAAFSPGPKRPLARNHTALLVAAEAIRRGQIVAVKGIGGFHLTAEGSNERAVCLLRKRKQREEKPFALMFPSLESVKAICEVSALEERLLRSPEAPIVLLRRCSQSSIANPTFQIAEDVAPANPNLAALLPSNPLHHLLMAELGFPVVATSGNLNDEPICTDEREALERLREIADAFLVHNRPIIRHADDSIVRVMLDREMILRRARGYAPLPIIVAAGVPPAVEPGILPGEKGVEIPTRVEQACANPGGKLPPSTTGRMPAATILAVGAHLKNSIALSVGDQVFISQHIGDLETEPANNAFRRVIADFEKLYDAQSDIIVSDLHPDYISTKFAQDKARSSSFSRSGPPEGGTPNNKTQAGSPRYVGVQHHVAHVLSCMAENEIQPPALGVAWDGTGYGTDGTIWGGEFFLVTDQKIERVAHLRPFRLPGGDKAVKEPRRAAAGLLYEMLGGAAFERKDLPSIAAFSSTELSAVRTMLARELNSPFCSSAGRLFDTVASLVNLRQRIRFEGQAAMELEFTLEGIETDEHYGLPLVTRHSPLLIDWLPMIEAILADAKRAVPVGEISAKFHNALVEAVVAVAKRVGQSRVVLSGGCFQNRYLTERTVKRLCEEKFQPYWHQRVPTNDGGICLGQFVAARRELAGAARNAVRTPQRGVPTLTS